MYMYHVFTSSNTFTHMKYIHTCISMYMYTCVYVFLIKYINTCTSMYMYSHQIHKHMYKYVYVFLIKHIPSYIWDLQVHVCVCVRQRECVYGTRRHCYGVATCSRLLEMIGLFCRISSLLLGSFAKETYNFKEPTNRSHHIATWKRLVHLIKYIHACTYLVTYIYTHTSVYSLVLLLCLSLSLSQIPSFSFTLDVFYTLSLSLSLTHSLIHTHTHTYSDALFCPVHWTNTSTAFLYIYLCPSLYQ